MRFFQPLRQIGYARTLAETRTHFPLSPGMIAINQPEITEGYAAILDMPFPPDFDDVNEAGYSLTWILPEDKMDKYHSTKFQLSEQPFYPPFAE